MIDTVSSEYSSTKGGTAMVPTGSWRRFLTQSCPPSHTRRPNWCSLRRSSASTGRQIYYWPDRFQPPWACRWSVFHWSSRHIIVPSHVEYTGSIAAAIQALIGNVASGSLFALLQSLAMGGPLGGVLGTIGGIVGGIIGAIGVGAFF